MNNSNPSAVLSATNPLSDSIRLWDDPFDAPEVPDKATLRDYLVNPDHVHPDLADQIRESVNVQRALEVLRLEQGTHPAADVLQGLPRETANDTVSAALATQLTNLLPKQKGIITSPRFSEKDVFLSPQPGQLWLTREEVKVWHDGRLASRWINTPPMVLITEKADTMPNGDTVVRGVATSPAAHWPSDWLASDEIRVTTDQSDPYVAHLWLEYPVSRLQLLKPIAVLDTASLENLLVARTAFMEGLDLSDQERCGRELDLAIDSIILLERERLAAHAAWLGATSQARRAQVETEDVASTTSKQANCWTPFPWPELNSPLDSLERTGGGRAAKAKGSETMIQQRRGVKYLVPTRDDLEISMFMVDSDCIFRVWCKKEGSDELDGACIVTAANGDSVPFKNGRVKLPMSAIKSGFLLRFSDSQIVTLIEKKQNA